jgi:hypothetical protein
MFTRANTAGLDKCGVEVPLPEYQGKGVTAYTAGARAKGQPVYFTFTATAGQELTAATPTTITYVAMGWAYDAVAAGKIGLFVISGINVPILVSVGSAIAAGECLEVITGGTYAIDQGGTTVMGDASVVAVLQEAVTAAEVTAYAALSVTNVLKKSLVIPNTSFMAVAAAKEVEGS